MTTPTTAQTVTRIIAEELHLHPAALTPATVLADLGADSLDLVSIAFELEEALQIDQLDAADMEGIKTVGDMIRLVECMVSA